MEMSGTIVDHIIEIKDSLPKKQRQLCNYIVLHSGEAGMMTVAELAQHAGVGTTTVMRLVQDLGYDSYNRLKRDIMSASMRQLGSSYGNRMQTLSFDSKSGKEHTLEHVLTDFRQVSVNLLTQNNQEQFNKAVDLLLKASWINVLGLRSAAFDIDCDGEEFTFTTDGYGHGVGMSQTGADLYASEEGWDYVDILTHYYPGTQVG